MGGWAQVLGSGGVAAAILAFLGLIARGLFGKRKLAADAHVTEADAAERLQRVSATIAENAQAQIEAARAWAAHEVARARDDVERARLDADEARRSANSAWQGALQAQSEMMKMATQWRSVVTEVRSPARSWERLEALIGDGGALNGAALHH